MPQNPSSQGPSWIAALDEYLQSQELFRQGSPRRHPPQPQPPSIRDLPNPAASCAPCYHGMAHPLLNLPRKIAARAKLSSKTTSTHRQSAGSCLPSHSLFHRPFGLRHTRQRSLLTMRPRGHGPHFAPCCAPLAPTSHLLPSSSANASIGKAKAAVKACSCTESTQTSRLAHAPRANMPICPRKLASPLRKMPGITDRRSVSARDSHQRAQP